MARRLAYKVSLLSIVDCETLSGIKEAAHKLGYDIDVRYYKDGDDMDIQLFSVTSLKTTPPTSLSLLYVNRYFHATKPGLEALASSVISSITQDQRKETAKIHSK